MGVAIVHLLLFIVIPAKAGIQTAAVPRSESDWIPAFEGMTGTEGFFG